MLKTKVKRPYRIYTNEDYPYIKYKSKKFLIKGSNIDEIINIIKKLYKKKNKKIQYHKKPKRDIKKYLNESIKLIGSTINPIPPLDIKNIEKETFKTNELNNKIIKLQDKIKVLKDDEKKIEKIGLEYKSIEQKDIKELIKYNKKNKKYYLKTKIFDIDGDTIEEIKDKLDKGYDNYMLKYNQLEDDKLLLEKKKLEIEEKLKNEITLFSDAFSILERDTQELKKEKEILNVEKFLNKYSVEQLNKKYLSLLGHNRDSKAEFSTIIDNLYNTNFVKKNKIDKVDKEYVIKYIIDNMDINKIYNPEQQIQIQQPEQQIQIQQEEQGDGKINNQGLYNYQIDTIMKPFKYYISCISEKQLDDVFNYIIDNKIYKGSFILNV